MAPAIEIVGVTKQFRRHTEPSKTIKERLLSWRKNEVQTFDALHDVNLEVAAGETVGLLGHNGSGKSTLLKCIAGTIRPTEGEIRVHGRMAAMLELGAGFHPDLSGRENVYLNGSILGFSKMHVNRIFDEIVAFAELEDFIDTQVKYYSSGMYARLGFAVAVNLEPDVLLVDEVLSVGDEAFQRKCLERVRVFQKEGRTIVLVTHSPDQVSQLCDRAMVLDHGNVLHVGETTEAARVFRHALNAGSQSGAVEQVEETEGPEVVESTMPLRIVGARAVGPDGEAVLGTGDDLDLELHYRATEQIPGVRARLLLTSHDGVQMLNIATHDLLRRDLEAVDGEGVVCFTIRDLPLLDGTYRVGFILQDPAETFQYDQVLDAASFDVYTGEPITGRVRLDIEVDHRAGHVIR